MHPSPDTVIVPWFADSGANAGAVEKNAFAAIITPAKCYSRTLKINICTVTKTWIKITDNDETKYGHMRQMFEIVARAERRHLISKFGKTI